MRALFLDTSYCIALANSADTHQKSAQAWLRWLKESCPALHLHDGILLEIGNGFARRGATKLGIKVIDGLLEDATVVRHALSVDEPTDLLSEYGSMAEVIWTEPALGDLDAIADFIALENPGAARELVQRPALERPADEMPARKQA